MKKIAKSLISVFCAFSCLILFACSSSPETTTTTTTSVVTAVYVSDAGNDSNDGLSASRPLASLSKALSVAVAYHAPNLLVSGNFVLTNAGNDAGWCISGVSDLTISGGWSSNFSSQTEYGSTLDSMQKCCHPVAITNCANLTLTNFILSGGYRISSGAFFQYGGGLNAIDSTGLVVVCKITGNTNYYGGGIYAYYCTSCAFDGTISGNTATASGGGIYAYYCTSCAFDGAVSGNTATASGGGIYPSSCTSCTFDGAVSGNTASENGGGIYSYSCTSCAFDGTVSGNTATASGGGIYTRASISCTFSGTISGNMASGNGGGVYTYSCQYCTFDSAVSGNTAAGNGGGIIAGVCTSCDIGGMIGNNKAGGYGGGIYLFSTSMSTFITATIRYNHCNNDDSGSETGGGVYNAGSGYFLDAGAIVEYNYRGSSMTTEDNIVGF